MTEYLLKTRHSRAYGIFYRALKATIGSFFKLIYRMEIKGLEKIPLEGGFILCSNHQSYIDPVLIGLMFPRYLYFMAKVEIFKNRILAGIVKFFNAFPVNRRAFDRQAIRLSIKIIEAGEVVGIFPEGTRATDGNIKDGQKGIGLISLLAKSPIMPVAISGSNMIIRKPHKRLYFPKIKIAFGEIINIRNVVSEPGSRNAPEIIVKKVMDSIKELYMQINA